MVGFLQAICIAGITANEREIMEDQEIINEFLIESNDNLGRLDQEMVELERRPKDAELLGSVFRTFHTIKGTCGFLGYGKLERVAHQAENVLSQLRSGSLTLNSDLASVILEAVDVMRLHLGGIEASGQEAAGESADLCRRLEESARGNSQAAAPSVAPPPEVEAAAQKAPAGVADSAIRVDVGLLDKLMNLVGELVLARNQILQFSARQEGAFAGGTSQRLNLLTTELQAGVMKTRMQPIGNIWNKFPRIGPRPRRGLRQAGAPRDGRRGDRAGQDHHRGHPRPAHPHRAQRGRPRHRAARAYGWAAGKPARGPHFPARLPRGRARSSSRSPTTAAASTPRRSSRRRCRTA